MAARRDYASAMREFSVAALEREVLSRPLAQGVNACFECCDRHASGGRVALHWIGKAFERETWTFADFAKSSARFANVLKRRGIGKGDVVAGLLPRIPELITVILGTWRAGAIYQPLFTAFGPSAIESRVTGEGGSGAKLIVVDPANLPKLAEVPRCPPTLVVDRAAGGGAFGEAMKAESDVFAPVMLHGDDPFVILFTSGTTGKPKAVVWTLNYLLPFAVYLRDAIELLPDDTYWCAADPGWAYGMICTVTGPLLLGDATRMHEAGFTAEGAARLMREEKITNMAAAPTLYRLLKAAGDDVMAPLAGQLRVLSSAGEPLNEEVAKWARDALKAPLRDHYGQTEMGMAVNNHHGLVHAVKPNSAGLPMPGFALAVLDDDLKPLPPGKAGVLAIDRTRSPLFFFSGYHKASTPALTERWYVTGDTMTMDADGHFAFVGRNDDVITSAGYRIGPFDVESAVMETPAVAEVAVIGKPDAERTEIVKAFVVLRKGFAPSDALAKEIQAHVRARLGAHAYPREVEFLEELPKTPSGKTQRFVLRKMG
jgi:acetyl-CoA synthetase